MNNEVTPKTKEVWRSLATAIADALERPECPLALAESLTEVANQLFGLFEDGRGHSLTVAMLRAVVGKAESVNDGTRPDAEKSLTAKSSAKTSG